MFTKFSPLDHLNPTCTLTLFYVLKFQFNVKSTDLWNVMVYRLLGVQPDYIDYTYVPEGSTLVVIAVMTSVPAILIIFSQLCSHLQSFLPLLGFPAILFQIILIYFIWILNHYSFHSSNILTTFHKVWFIVLQVVVAQTVFGRRFDIFCTGFCSPTDVHVILQKVILLTKQKVKFFCA